MGSGERLIQSQPVLRAAVRQLASWNKNLIIISNNDYIHV